MKTYCLLNHSLTENQIKELKEKYQSETIVYPEKELSMKWAQVSTDEKIDRNLINEVIDWMKDSKEGDQLIIQGEAGHSFVLVDWAMKNGIIPLHAVTKRVEVEKKEGEVITKQHIFCHVCFRKYESY